MFLCVIYARAVSFLGVCFALQMSKSVGGWLLSRFLEFICLCTFRRGFFNPIIPPTQWFTLLDLQMIYNMTFYNSCFTPLAVHVLCHWLVVPLHFNHSSSNSEHKKCEDYVEGIFKRWDKEFWGTFNSLDHY